MSRYIDAELADKLLTEGYSIDEVPTANVEEVRHGEWISQPSMDDRYSRYYICSVCGRLEQVSHAYDIKTFSPYCHCGAKMDREKEKWQNLK